MKKDLIYLFFFFIICSCNNKQANKSTNNVISQDTKSSLQATVKTSLHDNVQPSIISLDTMPKPLTVEVPKSTGGFYSITNSKGETEKINLIPLISKKADFYSPMNSFNAEDGLYSGINFIKMDKTGNIWFGTNGGGVSRYDGKSFTTYTTAHGLASNVIKSITEDKKGNIWFATADGGVSLYNGKFFITYSVAQGLSRNQVTSIAEDPKGDLWFGTAGGGVSRFNGKLFTTYTTADGLANNFINCITLDKAGKLWIGTQGGGVSCKDPSSKLGTNSNIFTNYNTTHGLANNDIRSIVEDKNGKLWFGTWGGGISCYDIKLKKGTAPRLFSTYTTSQGLANNKVNCITEDKSGNLWFGTQGGGVSCYEQSVSDEPNSKSFITFTKSQGLTSNIINSIEMDKNGNLWFGTSGGGVCIYIGKSITKYTTAQGLADNSVWGVTEDKSGNIWFGTSGGVSRYDEKSFTTFTSAQGLVNDQVLCLTQDKAGNLWFGTQGGVSRFIPSKNGGTNGGTFISFTTAQGLGNNFVHSITEDKKGNIWFGTHGGGASCFTLPINSGTNSGTFTNYTTVNGLGSNVVQSILEDISGNLWFATYGGGVSRYNPVKDGGIFTTFTTNHGLSSNLVYSIAEDKCGNLWFATDGGGVSRYDGKSFTNYTTTQGLANNTVYSIAQDKTGNLWFGTNEGFCLLKGFKKRNTTYSSLRNKISFGMRDLEGANKHSNPTLYEKFIPVFEKYNLKSGYRVIDVNTNAMYMDSKGIMWAGTGEQLVRFDYRSIYNKNTEPNKVNIHAIKINGENICWNLLSRRATIQDSLAMISEEVTVYGDVLTPERRHAMLQKFSNVQFDGITPFYPVPIHLVLPYNHNNITFDFGAVEVTKPYLVNYQYMLEGNDKDWYPLTNASTATFGNLGQGTYTFKVKAQNPDGVWSAPIYYTFTVLPPWWETWWMYILYILSFLLALRVFTKYREKALVHEKEKLEEQVALRTVQLDERNKVVELEKKKSEDLLLNILPAEVAEELKETGLANAKQFNNVTVLFTDFVNFTGISENMSPKDLVAEIHQNFSAFDVIIEKHGLEKIKTIGDAYMSVCGLPLESKDHADRAVKAALEIRDYIAQNEGKFQIRIGVHSGPVVAGIVGVKKYAYDIWGDTVNTANRMESSGEAGKVNISGTTHALVKDKFSCTHRGKIKAKGKGEIDMYFVEV